jgi:hypothetical protein
VYIAELVYMMLSVYSLRERTRSRTRCKDFVFAYPPKTVREPKTMEQHINSLPTFISK